MNLTLTAPITDPSRGRKRARDARRHGKHYERRKARAIAQYGSYAAYRTRERRRDGQLPKDERKSITAQKREARKRVRRQEVAARKAARRKPWYGLPKPEQMRMRRRLDPTYRQYDILRAFCRKRRLRQAADGTVTPAALRALMASTKRCYLCRKALHGRLSFDHVVPIAAGGAHSMANLAVVHLPCNLKKKAQVRTIV